MNVEEKTVIALGDQALHLFSDWLPATQAAQLLRELTRDLPWQQERIRLFGRDVAVPRLQCWIGDPGTRYRYSGLTLEPQPWPPALLDIRRQLQAACGEDFNSVLCNWYRSGRDSMGWHADDEPELGPAPIVASLTLGASRRFQFRRRGTNRVDSSLELPHNSLLLMPGGIQEHWQHQLPKTTRVIGSRLNFTFRQVRLTAPG